MRIMVKFTFPANPGNELVRSGKVGQIFEKLMTELKPEAAYFFPEDGDRAGLMVVNMEQPSQVAEVAERFFLGLNAKIRLTPVMSAEDLQHGLSGLEDVVRSYS